MPTALVIDGAYFLRRYPKALPQFGGTATDAARAVEWLAFWHVAHRTFAPDFQQVTWTEGCRPSESNDLYRIFFYDCPPLLKKMHRPMSGKAYDLSKTPDAAFRLAVHAALLKARKVALRLGRLSDETDWRLRYDTVQRLRANEVLALTDDDFEIDTKQKGVDMKLGLDVAALAFNRQVDQIVLIAGDADFVPATKLARRAGIDVVLDPMGGFPAKDLVHHVDGVRSCHISGRSS